MANERNDLAVVGVIEMRVYRCLRCPAQWTGRKKEFPKSCPRCTSRSWNIPRRELKGCHGDAGK